MKSRDAFVIMFATSVCNTYEEFEAFLESMGICLPPGLMDELLEDQRLNVGNKQRTWG